MIISVIISVVMNTTSADWHIGFEHSSIKADCMDRNPGWTAITDPSQGLAFGAVVAMVSNREDAERIVRAVNAHDDLVRALSGIIQSAFFSPAGFSSEAGRRAVAALEKAEGK